MVVPAMVTKYCTVDGFATEQYISYHEAKAKGGWGLIIAEDYRIAPNTGASAILPGLFTEEHIQSHRELTRRVHAAGGKIFAQIYHAGLQANRENLHCFYCHTTTIIKTAAVYVASLIGNGRKEHYKRIL